MAVTARGLAKAADILAGQFTLVATNVPYLGQLKQSEGLKTHIFANWEAGKSDLALAFSLRCHELTGGSGHTAIVLPQGWLTQSHDKEFRKYLLSHFHLAVIARLGSNAFTSSIGQQVMMFIFGAGMHLERNVTTFIDALDGNGPGDKSKSLGEHPVRRIAQEQHQNQIVTEDTSVGTTLGIYADCLQGLSTGEKNRFERYFWEISCLEST
jgi:type I restriction-modification system DNA methylase subunit